MPKKLKPKNPGARVVSRTSLAKKSGMRGPMDGAGSRGTGKPKLNPTNGAGSLNVKTGQSGPMGPKNGVRS